MKKIFSLLLLCAFIFLGCEKNNQNQAQLVGNWKLTEYRTSENSSFQPWQTPETTVTFKEDGLFISHGYFGSGSGSYRLEGTYLRLYNEEGLIAEFIIESLSSDEIVVIMESDYYFKFKKY